MTQADLSNPNACLVCDPAVSASDARDEGAQPLHRFTADACLTLDQAAHVQSEAA